MPEEMEPLPYDGGERLYARYADIALEEAGVYMDAWSDLEDWDKNAWTRLASIVDF